jgi:hypothetical protein
MGREVRGVASGVFVLVAAKRKRGEASVVPLRAERLAEAEPGHVVVVDEYPGLQGPAADLAAVTAEQRDRADLRPVGRAGLAEEV